MPAQKESAPRNRTCRFCEQNVDRIDYKDARFLGRFINPYSKIDARRRSGNCARHQRMLTTAIKRARIVAILPFTTR